MRTRGVYCIYIDNEFKFLPTKSEHTPMMPVQQFQQSNSNGSQENKKRKREEVSYLNESDQKWQ